MLPSNGISKTELNEFLVENSSAINDLQDRIIDSSQSFLNAGLKGLPNKAKVKAQSALHAGSISDFFETVSPFAAELRTLDRNMPYWEIKDACCFYIDAISYTPLFGGKQRRGQLITFANNLITEANDQIKKQALSKNLSDYGLDDEEQRISCDKVSIGDEVFWTDPNEGISSGYYFVTDIYKEKGDPFTSDTILFIKNDKGSQAAVFFKELDISENSSTPTFK